MCPCSAFSLRKIRCTDEGGNQETRASRWNARCVWVGRLCVASASSSSLKYTALESLLLNPARFALASEAAEALRFPLRLSHLA